MWAVLALIGNIRGACVKKGSGSSRETSGLGLGEKPCCLHSHVWLTQVNLATFFLIVLRDFLIKYIKDCHLAKRNRKNKTFLVHIAQPYKESARLPADKNSEKATRPFLFSAKTKSSSVPRFHIQGKNAILICCFKVLVKVMYNTERSSNYM